MPAIAIGAFVIGLSGCSSGSTPSPSTGRTLAPNSKAYSSTCVALKEIVEAVTDTPEPVNAALKQAQADLASAVSLARAEGASKVVAAIATLNSDIERLKVQIAQGVNAQTLASSSRRVSNDADAVPVDCAGFS